MPNYDLVLLDMDGTIANTDAMIVETFHRMYKVFKPTVIRSDEELLYFSGPPIKQTLLKEFPDYPLEEIFPAYREISKGTYLDFIKEFPKVRETLISFMNKGIKVGVITNKNSSNADLTLKIIHLDDVIDYCLGSDDVPATKPNPVSVGMAMEHFNILDKSKVIYVGDNTIDFTFASNAGIDCALLTWGPRKFDPSTNPKYWVKDFDELYKVIVG